VRLLIVNADDFGYATGVNRGIVDCHVRGIVTSTSLMVTGHAVTEAVELANEHSALSIGLHWDVWGEDEREFDLDDETAIRDEFERQLEEFQRLLGRMPTHVDTHRHAHRKWGGRLMPLFTELVAPLGVPLRDDGRVGFVGDFYGQWEWKVTNLEYISVPSLQRLLREKVGDGWTELSCHPGYASPDYSSVYYSEREVEVRTLTDPRARRTIDELGIQLVGYADWKRR
jgi:predicted glycoside hydrolase/deacetylase ChbG (UPF0249 family)